MAGMTKPLLALAGVTKHYDSGAGKVTVLAGVNLTLTAGESLAIVGPSGCGKSTLLNIIGTLDRPSSGRVELDGRDLTGLDEVALAGVRNREIGFVFQAHHLLPQCTVLENVLVPTLPLTDAGLKESAPARARQILEKVGLGSRLGHRPGQLSGGERQRVAVVRALINRPKLLLADEPTGALDRHSAENLGDLLVRLNAEEGVSLVVVTHAIELAKRMQRVFELRDGTLHELVDAH
jgi:ABC-type lipoprotein export system ATPase subunit